MRWPRAVGGLGTYSRSSCRESQSVSGLTPPGLAPSGLASPGLWPLRALLPLPAAWGLALALALALALWLARRPGLALGLGLGLPVPLAAPQLARATVTTRIIG